MKESAIQKIEERREKIKWMRGEQKETRMGAKEGEIGKKV